MLRLTAITILALFSRLSLAAQCAAQAYAGAGPGKTCTGQRLASNAQSGKGRSPCQLAVNAACVDITHEVGGSDCDVILFDDLDCGYYNWSSWLECVDEGDVWQHSFASFLIQCTE